jgi:hypothetical protein
MHMHGRKQPNDTPHPPPNNSMSTDEAIHTLTYCTHCITELNGQLNCTHCHGSCVPFTRQDSAQAARLQVFNSCPDSHIRLPSLIIGVLSHPLT